MRTNDEIIDLIIKLKNDKNMSLSELARQTGIAKSALSRYFNKSRQFPLNKANDFAKVLNTTSEYILGFDNTNDSIVKEPTIFNAVSFPQQITVYGKVCAGNGIEAFEDPIDEITNPYHRIKGDMFALQVDGDSMNNVVRSGMYAIIQKQSLVKNGEIAVILIDNEVGMLKRFFKLDNSTVVLKPDSTNSEHKTMIFEGNDINRLKILGRYIGQVSPMENLL
ncbi:helix-turn-helix domain-containing protein [Turicibacter sanguinis]|nr:helix-turn-helix domain-containing protein [Turicibacter sanguinis]